MSLENNERLEQVESIVYLRDQSRENFSILGYKSQEWRRIQNPFMWILALGLVIAVNFIPVPVIERMLIVAGCFLLISVINVVSFSIVYRKIQGKTDQYDKEFKKELVAYLEKYYEVNPRDFKYGLMAIAHYGLEGGKVKLISTYNYDLPVVPVNNEIVKTPDINGILYYDSFSVKGERLKDVIVQLTPERNIVLLHEGKEIEPVSVI